MDEKVSALVEAVKVISLEADILPRNLLSGKQSVAISHENYLAIMDACHRLEVSSSRFDSYNPPGMRSCPNPKCCWRGIKSEGEKLQQRFGVLCPVCKVVIWEVG